jgi:methionyl-tRNA formyltransferase
MAMEEGLDTGPVLLERSLNIGLLENAELLAQRMSALTAELLVEALERVERVGPGEEPERLERLGVRRQSEDGMTYARMFRKDDFRIDWTQASLDIHRRVMGLYPGATTGWQGRRLKLLSTEPLLPGRRDELSPEAAALLPDWTGRGSAIAPGTILGWAPGVGLLVACGDAEPLLIRAARIEGKAVAEADRLWQQLGARAGDRLELASG